jgi:pilus assembly protein CpaF
MIGVRPRTRIDDRKSFQKLKVALERRIVDAVDLSRAPELGERELRDQVKALATQVCASESVGLPADVRETMVREILDDIYGFGPLEPLMNDPEVSDVLVNGPDNVSVERGGRLQETEIRFADEAHLRQLIDRLVRRAGQRINERSPVVEAKLPDGSFLNAVLTPLAHRGPMLSLRRGGLKTVGLEDLVRRGSLAPGMVDFLTAAVRGRLNILISGATGAGKTTLLGSLGRLIPESERIVTIEQTAELDLGRANVVALEAGSRVAGQIPVTLRELLRSGLHMQPDRLMVGEVCGNEVLDLLHALSTGHPGSLLTVNAIGTRDAVERIELLTASGDGRPSSGLYHQIASAFQILVHVARLTSGECKVVRISELCGHFDRSYAIEDVFVYRAAGTDDLGQSLGSFYSTGHEPLCLSQLASLGHVLESELFIPKELSTAQPTLATIQN